MGDLMKKLADISFFESLDVRGSSSLFAFNGLGNVLVVNKEDSDDSLPPTDRPEQLRASTFDPDSLPPTGRRDAQSSSKTEEDLPPTDPLAGTGETNETSDVIAPRTQEEVIEDELEKRNILPKQNTSVTSPSSQTQGRGPSDGQIARLNKVASLVFQQRKAPQELDLAWRDFDNMRKSFLAQIYNAYPTKKVPRVLYDIVRKIKDAQITIQGVVAAARRANALGESGVKELGKRLTELQGTSVGS